MITEYTRTFYEEVKKEMMESREISNVWIENIDANVYSLVGFIQLFSETMSTTLNGTALVPESVHAIFVGLSSRRGKWLIANGHTLRISRPVWCTYEDL